MKKFLLLILICFSQNISSQTIKEDYKTEIPSNEIFKSQEVEGPDYIYNAAAVEVNPEFPEGIEFLSAFIQQNYKNPKEGLTGKVYANFIVEKDGSLSDIKILRDVGYGTAAEAIRILKLSPKWIPGKLNGKDVRVRYTIPISVN